MICGRCYEETTCLPANCAEKPEQQDGALGMYHCPDCGAVLMAGFLHPYLCELCLTRTHPLFDAPSESQGEEEP